MSGFYHANEFIQIIHSELSHNKHWCLLISVLLLLVHPFADVLYSKYQQIPRIQLEVVI